MDQKSEKALNSSSIREFYSGKSILITGATGLVGKVLLYKILLSIKCIENVYILIRAKRNKDINERFKELIERSRGLFDSIDSKDLRKVIPIEANLTTVGMDLSDNDRNTIIEKVSIVFHSAADVTFDTKLREQLLINVGGTKEIIDLCRQMKNLEVFEYVSTAYSSPLQPIVKEVIYKSCVDPLEILNKARNTRKEMITLDYIGQYPNTYSFTKNLSENLVNQEFEKDGFPVTVVRPGIVLNSYKEPICGWFDSITSIMGMFLMMGVGFARIFKTDKNITCDIIPVDIVANTCIAAAADAYKTKQSAPNKVVKVFNCNSSCMGAITFNEMANYLYGVIQKYPLLYTVRPPVNALTDKEWLPIGLMRFFTETCFAYFIDVLLWLFGRKRIVVKRVKLYQKMVKQVQPYIGRQWYFTNDNMIDLSNNMSDTDKTIFNCDIRAIDWYYYLETFFFYSRRLLLKEDKEDIITAQRNIKYIKTLYTIINHLLLYVLLCALTYVIIPSLSLSSRFPSIATNTAVFQYLNPVSLVSYLLIFSAMTNSIINCVEYNDDKHRVIPKAFD